MSEVSPTSIKVADSVANPNGVEGQHGASGGGGHDKNLAHHFDSMQQQFDAGKLGIWLFLTTEILLFSGMFCAYAVYRHNHPEVFAYASQWLDPVLGGINTLVLIFSSFTMAWAVRASQLGQRKLLIYLLAITLVCGFGFLGIKFVEYKAKWQHHTLWGTGYHPSYPPGVQTEHKPATAPALIPPGETVVHSVDGTHIEQSQIAPAAVGPRGVASAVAHPALEMAEPNNVQVFFGIYFIMTGLHGLHVIAGLVVIAWLLKRSIRGDFGPKYYSPVDFTGLYWHVVDLIWIFLFPLLYLIHSIPS